MEDNTPLPPVSRQQRKKREAACSQMSENFDQLCARSADADDSCSFMLEDMEEMECGDYKQEKVRVEKREECRAIQKRFEQVTQLHFIILQL